MSEPCPHSWYTMLAKSPFKQTVWNTRRRENRTMDVLYSVMYCILRVTGNQQATSTNEYDC